MSSAILGRAVAPVSILLLGSGWTSKFVAPLLSANRVPFAQTRRNPPTTDDASAVYPFTADEGSLSADDCQHLPCAELVVVVFPLRSTLVQRLVQAYEGGTGCTPAWLALGSTGAWSSCTGVCTADTPVSRTSERAQAEQVLLDLHQQDGAQRRQTAVLNLSGLYGGERNPCNFAKRACETRNKVARKTSLHLVHGRDVARAILAMHRSLLSNGEERAPLWGRRWIVTDGQVYDWWQLLSTLKPTPIADGGDWVQELMQQHGIERLPRPWPSESSDRPPKVMERVIDGRAFWDTLGERPSVGRCDDYGPGGGGEMVNKGLL